MKQQVTVCKKTEVFVVSFLAYTTIHALRTTYSFSKAYVPASIHVEEELIGLVDSVMLLCVGLGNLLIATRIGPGRITNPVLTLWVSLILCALQYCLVPFSISMMTGYPAFFTLLALMGLSGFLQAFAWPNLLPLVRTVTDPDRDSALLGFWATCPNVGNIMGFCICQYFVLVRGLGWGFSMYLVAGYMLVMGLIIALRIDEFKQEEVRESPNMIPLLEQEAPEHLSVFVVFKSPRVILLTISFTLLKSVMYGILLWLPAYFHAIGLVDYELYIPMVFDASSIVGSVLLGAIFKLMAPAHRNITLVPVLCILIVAFSVLKSFDLSVAGYFGVIGLVGVCLGGSYNTMASLVTMELARSVPAQYQASSLQFFSALLMAMGNTVTAITQVIISFAVGQNEENKLFSIFLVYTCINLCSMVGAVIIQFRDKSLSQLVRLRSSSSIEIVSMPTEGRIEPHPDEGRVEPHPDEGRVEPHPDEGRVEPSANRVEPPAGSHDE